MGKSIIIYISITLKIVRNTRDIVRNALKYSIALTEYRIYQTFIVQKSYFSRCEPWCNFHLKDSAEEHPGWYLVFHTFDALPISNQKKIMIYTSMGEEKKMLHF